MDSRRADFKPDSYRGWSRHGVRAGDDERLGLADIAGPPRGFQPPSGPRDRRT